MAIFLFPFIIYFNWHLLYVSVKQLWVLEMLGNCYSEYLTRCYTAPSWFYVFNGALMGIGKRDVALQLSREATLCQDTQDFKGKEILYINHGRYFWDETCDSLRSLPASLAFAYCGSFHLLCCLQLHVAYAHLGLLMRNFIYWIADWFQRKPNSFFCSITLYNQWMQLEYCFPSVSIIYID